MTSLSERQGRQTASSMPTLPVEPHSSRHPGDAARVVLGIAVLLLAGLAVQREQLSTFEADVFRLINDLPSGLEPMLVAIMQAGNVVAAPVLAVVIVAFNRKRLRVALDVSASGAVAWIAAKAIKSMVERPRPAGFFDDVLRFGQSGGLGFVSGHMAVAAAIATASAPYLPRRWRRVVWGLAWTVGFARVYVGAHLPLDIIGGAALGWIVAAGAHLLLGAPHRVPGLGEAARVVRRGTAELVDVQRVEANARGSFPFTAATAEGRIFIKLLDPEPRDRDWIYRAARFLAFRDVRDEAAIVDAPAQAYREAAMTLLARSSGAKVPAVRGIERDGDRVWIIQDHVPGRDLRRVDSSEIDDAVLRELWRQLQLLRSSRLAHRDLVSSNLILDDAGQPWIVDLAHAISSASSSAMDNDAAELLVTTSLLVGTDRAVAAAVEILGSDGVVGALTELQPLALTPESRRALAADPSQLSGLRAALETAIGVEPVVDHYEAKHPNPVREVAAVVLGSTLCAALVVIAGAGAVADSWATLSPRWVGVAAIAAAVGGIAEAWALVAASGRRLAIGRTALVQLHAHARSVLLGSAAGDRVLVRYLSRSGVAFRRVLDATATLRRTRWLICALALVAGIVAAWEEEVGFDLAPRFAALAVVATAAAAMQWLLAGPRWFTPKPSRQRARQLEPMLVVGAGLGIATLAELAATVAVVSAFGTGPAVGVVVAIAVVTSMVGVFSSSRGAVGPGSTLMVVGLASAGMALAPAVAATLIVHLLRIWVPAAIGRLLARPLSAAAGR